MILATTPRLWVRHFEENDLDALVPILSDEEVMRYSTTGALSKEKIAAWLSRTIAQYEHPGFSPWAIILKENNTLIGFSGISPIELDGRMEIEILFRLAKPYWNQGYAYEATLACINYAFDTLGINTLIAIVDPKNERSLNVINKLNMIYEKDSVYKNIPVRVYRLNKFNPLSFEVKNNPKK